MVPSLLFALRQALLIGMAAFAYFRVRGLTEGNPMQADHNAGHVLDLERRLGIDFELGLQSLIGGSEWAVNLANWVYIWGHWPVVAATLI